MADEIAIWREKLDFFLQCLHVMICFFKLFPAYNDFCVKSFRICLYPPITKQIICRILVQKDLFSRLEEKEKSWESHLYVKLQKMDDSSSSPSFLPSSYASSPEANAISIQSEKATSFLLCGHPFKKRGKSYINIGFFHVLCHPPL